MATTNLKLQSLIALYTQIANDQADPLTYVAGLQAWALRAYAARPNKDNADIMAALNQVSETLNKR